jgi:sulfatase modifying factor 1
MSKTFCICRTSLSLSVFSYFSLLLSCNQRPGKPEVLSNDTEDQLELRRPSAKQNIIPLPPLGDAFTVTSSGTEMLFVNPGVFTMGSPTGEPGREAIETQHEVTLTQGFWLGKYEVTNLEWEKVMNSVEPPKEGEDDEDNGEKEPLADPYADVKRPKFPKVNVNWIEAMDFCDKLIAAEITFGTLPESFVYDLPTEAQWEYACRAGTITAVSFGEVLGAGDAAIDPKRPYGAVAKALIPKRIHKVGEYKPNPWGFYDMHGNTFEWCRDFFFARYPSGTVVNPLHEKNTGLKVKRGGSFFMAAASARSAKRGSDSPNLKSEEVGFRIVLIRE